MTADPRAAAEYRIPAAELRPGDLVNTSPGEDDWQEVLRVHRNAGTARDEATKTLVQSLGGRYVVVELTDLAPVDAGIYFTDDGDAGRLRRRRPPGRGCRQRRGRGADLPVHPVSSW